MARLYPPSIAGTIPSFYDMNGTVKVTVPFSLNKVVSVAAVSHCRLKIKRTDTDTLLGTVDSSSGTWQEKDSHTLILNFILPQSIVAKMIIGTSYKLQIAYVDQAGVEGYYSTVAIGKFTYEPEVTIAGFDVTRINFAKSVYVGQYVNLQDITEKVYQYCFEMYNFENNLVETSGWCIHNTYNDTDEDRSIDQYVFRHVIGVSETYKIQYCIKTGSGLELHSPLYLVASETTVSSNLKGSLSAVLDYENGAVDINITPRKDAHGQEEAETGAFIITRRSSKDNFTTEVTVSAFSLLGEVPRGTMFKDYTVESGVSYRYAVQQWNNENIHSNAIETETLKVYYEDAFLYDGKRQLKIRFNPKVASFKPMVLESKKNTIGSKYPYFFRNGVVDYKEFTISGLISYLMDNDGCFYSKEELGFKGQEDSFDHTDENIALEKAFKLAVLDWLNNGEIKLFKSPQEGNYIVRLSGVSLSPTEQLGRMLHTFNCTADEVADYADVALSEYQLISTENIVLERMRYNTINFQNWIDTQLAQPNTSLLDLVNKDITNGESMYHIKITNAAPGTILRINESQTIMIGATGQYEVLLHEPAYGLAFVSPSRIMPGELMYGTLTAVTSYFDLINSVDITDIPMMQTFGPNENMLADFNDLKHEIAQIYFLRFSRLEVQPVGDIHSIRPADCSPYNIYHDTWTDNYYIVNGNSWLPVPDIYEAMNIRFGNRPDGTPNILNVQDNEVLMFANDIEIPEQIEIGAGVCAEIALRVKIIHFGLESTLPVQKAAYEKARRDYMAACLGYVVVNKADIVTTGDEVYYYWNQEYFVQINRSEYGDYASSRAPAVYKPSGTPQSEAVIKQKYQTMQKAKREFFALLEDAIKEAEAI